MVVLFLSATALGNQIFLLPKPLIRLPSLTNTILAPNDNTLTQANITFMFKWIDINYAVQSSASMAASSYITLIRGTGVGEGAW